MSRKIPQKQKVNLDEDIGRLQISTAVIFLIYLRRHPAVSGRGGEGGERDHQHRRLQVQQDGPHPKLVGGEPGGRALRGEDTHHWVSVGHVRLVRYP